MCICVTKSRKWFGNHITLGPKPKHWDMEQSDVFKLCPLRISCLRKENKKNQLMGLNQLEMRHPQKQKKRVRASDITCACQYPPIDCMFIPQGPKQTDQWSHSQSIMLQESSTHCNKVLKSLENLSVHYNKHLSIAFSARILKHHWGEF